MSCCSPYCKCCNAKGSRALHHIYETRARSYRDAIQEFVEGYKEGYVGQATVQPDKLKDVDNLTKPTKPDATNADSKAVSTKA